VDVHFKIEMRIKNDCRRKSTSKHLKTTVAVSFYFFCKTKPPDRFSYSGFQAWNMGG